MTCVSFCERSQTVGWHVTRTQRPRGVFCIGLGFSALLFVCNLRTVYHIWVPRVYLILERVCGGEWVG